MKALILTLVLAAVVSLDTPRARAEASPDAAGCDRACLKGMLDSYFAAMLKHDPSGLPLSPCLKAPKTGIRSSWERGFGKLPRPLPSGLMRSILRVVRPARNR
jgi:hypothetical protein